jgi:hypothetical protein
MEMAASVEFSPISDAIEKGLEKIHKWHKEVKTTNMYFICLGECSSFI